MKVTLKIEIEFDSWFKDEREPKTNEDWAEFFSTNLMPKGSILGTYDGENQDIIALNSYNIECLEVY